jgi:hypothetical protein
LFAVSAFSITLTSESSNFFELVVAGRGDPLRLDPHKTV